MYDYIKSENLVLGRRLFVHFVTRKKSIKRKSPTKSYFYVEYPILRMFEFFRKVPFSQLENPRS